MAINRKLIMAKARGFTISIEKVGEKERFHHPGGAFAHDYNRLLASTTDLYPEFVGMFPPTVATWTASNGGEHSHSTFAELDAYCEQIFQLLSECPDREK